MRGRERSAARRSAPRSPPTPPRARPRAAHRARRSICRRIASFASRSAAPADRASARRRPCRHGAMVTHRGRGRARAPRWPRLREMPIIAPSPRGVRHEPQPPALSRSPRGAAAADARADRRRACPRADRGRSAAQPRFAVSRTGTTATSITCPGFPSPRRSSRSSPAPDGDRHILFCREKNAGARDLGRLSLRTRRRARDLRLRRGASDRRARRGCCRISRPTGPRCTRRSGLFAAWDQQDHRSAERSARPRAHGRRRAGGDRRRAAGARCAAAREGRARDRT